MKLQKKVPGRVVANKPRKTCRKTRVLRRLLAPFISQHESQFRDGVDLVQPQSEGTIKLVTSTAVVSPWILKMWDDGRQGFGRHIDALGVIVMQIGALYVLAHLIVWRFR